METIGFVTVSKGRLHHIRQTLPLMAAQQADKLIVVDYSCPDGTGDWVEANVPAAQVVRVTDDPGFSLTRARNIGARHAGTDWLVFADADIVTEAGWLAWMRDNLQGGRF